MNPITFNYLGNSSSIIQSHKGFGNGGIKLPTLI